MAFTFARFFRNLFKIHETLCSSVSNRAKHVAATIFSSWFKICSTEIFEYEFPALVLSTEHASQINEFVSSSAPVFHR